MTKVRSLWGRFVAGAAILLYHRVAELQVDPWDLAVTPANFDAHLDVLRRRGTVIPLHALVSQLRRGSVPRGSVAVTFDDGYADNLEAAKPALERRGIPATVFITTGALDGGREFWWDQLEGIFLTPGRLPPLLEIAVDGQMVRWSLNGAADYTERHAHEYTRWRPWKQPPTARHAMFADLWRRLRVVGDAERRTVLSELAGWAGRSGTARPSHRLLTWQEVRDLASDACITIGAHSVTHAPLASLSAAEQRHELTASRQTLEAILDRPVTTVAYPFGGPSDYTRETGAIARTAGFSCACAGRPGTVRRSSDAFALPRCHVPNVGGAEFEELLDRWLHLA